MLIITAAKIKAGKFVIENKYPVPVQVDFIFLQFFFYIRNQGQPFCKSTVNEMLIDFSDMQINESLYPVVIIFLDGFRMKKLFKTD